MAWVRIDDGYRLHPKMQMVGPLGRDLFLGALCHSNRYLTDGWLSVQELRALSDYEGLFVDSPSTLPGVYEQPRVDDVMEALIQATLLEYRDGRVLIHDYEQFQPTKAEVLAQRERWKEKKRRQREGPGAELHLLKERARKLVKEAVIRGRLVPKPCAVCKTTLNVEAHHEDYDKPLDVKWLCRRHHTEADRRLSGFKKGLSPGVSGSGEVMKSIVCPVCGPMPFKSDRRLREHIENLHPEIAEAVA